MKERDSAAETKLEQKWLSRRNLIWGAAGTALGTSLFHPQKAYAWNGDEDNERTSCAVTNPIPGGITPFKPFGVVVHHNPLKPANRVAVAGISDPSQITDFDGFVGLTHIRGGGTGTNTMTGATMSLAFQADMGFSQGKFVDIDGRQRRGTFAFV